MQKMHEIRTRKKYCTNKEKFCEECAEPVSEKEEEDNHICRGEYCFHCNKKHKTGDKQKCEEYKKEMEFLNKMTEQKCDIHEAKKILGINREK